MKSRSISIDDALPIAHLQLLPKSHSQLLAKGVFKISDLIEKWEAEALPFDELGPRTRSDIKVALAELKKARGKDGRVDWLQYLDQRSFSTSRIAFTSESLQHLALRERLRPIGTLHLRKGSNALQKAKIKNVGELIDRAREGIEKMKGAALVSHQEIFEALIELARVIRSDGSVDWESFAKKRGYLILPKEGVKRIDPRDALSLLLELCQRIAMHQFGKRSYNIIKKRFLVEPEKRATLSVLSGEHGIERERVRQIQEMVIRAIRKPIFEEDYRGLKFRLAKPVPALFCAARDHFLQMKQTDWQEPDWFGELGKLWNIDRSELLKYGDLLLVILGYKKTKDLQHPELEAWILSSTVSNADWNRRLMSLHAIYELLHKHNKGLNASEIANELNRSSHPVAADAIPALARLCSGIEKCEDRYRVCFKHLRSRTEQALRLFEERGKPIYHVELFEAINARLPKARHLSNKENLINQLSADSRFAPVGKSGNWILTKWGRETRSLTELAESVLAAAGKALSVDHIAREVFKMRHGSPSSIPMLLDLNPDRFRKLRHRIYGLTAWAETAESDWEGEDEVAKFVMDYFEKKKTRAVEFSELCRAFIKASGRSERSAQGVLSFHPIIQTEQTKEGKRMATLRPNWQQFKRTRKPSTRTPQSDRILKEALAMIDAAPNGKAPLTDIVNSLEAKLNTARSNIYTAIIRSKEIESLSVKGSPSKICQRTNPSK